MRRKNSNIRGQAVLEYLIVFSFLALISINMVQGLNNYVSDSVGGLAYALTQQLSVGVCQEECFFGGYRNGVN